MKLYVKKLTSLAMLATILALYAACAACTSVNATPAERALALTYQYQALEDTYKSQYTAAGEAERLWLKEQVAPTLDQARELVYLYSKSVLVGIPDTDSQLSAMALVRQVAQKFAEKVVTHD